MAGKNDSLIPLRTELAAGKLRPVYLLYGEEGYIKSQYEQKIISMIPDAGFPEFNHFRFEGQETELSEYDDALEGFPMMTDKKLVFIKDSRIFKRASEEVKTFWQSRLKSLADDTVILFSEDEADKRSVLYKAAAKAGMAVEFKYQSEADLVTWVGRQALNARLKMNKNDAKYLVGIVDPGMGNLRNEFDKLISYCEGSVTRSDIDKVVSKSTSIKIFDLTNAIMERSGDAAMKVLSELRTSNESAFGVLYLIESNAEKMLKTKYCGTKNQYEAAKRIGVPPFAAGLYLKSASHFSDELLIRMITRVPEIDFAIKNGRIDQWQAVEQYITECIHSAGGNL